VQYGLTFQPAQLATTLEIEDGGGELPAVTAGRAHDGSDRCHAPAIAYEGSVDAQDPAIVCAQAACLKQPLAVK